MKTRVIQDEPEPTEPAAREDAAADLRRPIDLPADELSADPHTNGDNQ